MPSFDLLSSLEVLTPRILLAGWWYPYRTAYHVLRSTRPDLHGPALWRETLRRANAPFEPEQPDVRAFQFPGSINGVEKEAHHLTLRTQSGAVRLRALADDLIQLRVSREGSFLEPFSYSVEKDEGDWPPAKARIRETKEYVELKTGAMAVRIDRATARLTVLDQAGNTLLEETMSAGYHPAMGFLHWEAEVDPQAAIYGLGEKAAALNLAGKRFELWNIDPAGYNRDQDPINLSVPFITLLSEKGAIGLFFDNSYRAWVDLGSQTPGQISYRAAGGEFRLYIMVGTPRSILERYTELTGRTLFPPLWFLGYQQSRWSYYPEDRLLEVAREFRQRNLPCDVLHLDIHYMDGYRCFTWDKRRFPDPPAMLARLHQQGFKALSIIDPGIKIDHHYDVYREGIERKAFITYPDGTRFSAPVWPEWCHFADFTDSDAREWWGGLYEGLLDDGLDAFWNDMNELAVITVRTMRDNYVPDEVIHHGDGRATTHAEIHNVYGMLMARASIEGLRRLRPDRRPALLTRAGWAGIQRYALHWTADNSSTWDHLLLSIQMVLNLGLSGIPITGPDVGGFGGEPTPELMARWMPVGAFMPFYRNHAMAHTRPQEPWTFGPEVEAISRKYLELRYRLLPYLYTAVWQAVEYGWPIVRSLSFMHPDDPNTYSLDDEFYFGDALLIAPVVRRGVRQRSVYLPPGEWFDYWTHQPHPGGQTTTAEAPLDMLPIFARAGATIPHWPVQQFVGEKTIDTLYLDAFVGSAEHESLLYEDDGETVHYRDEAMHRVSCLTLRKGRLTRQIERGTYQPSYTRMMVRLIGVEDEPRKVMVKGGDLVGWDYDQAGGTLAVTLDAPDGFTLDFS